ncbi:hypothetical protein [Burkholderia ubonensis]|uniref:hypothetical protein n=1 Tax=Burkholderia ubonensis TaxID=101571 RepID=UPI000B4E5A1C|nr:hypothetical protein [Burkholderia ubonensis]
MLIVLNKIIAVLCLLGSGSSFACTASENFDIYFSRNGASVPSEEIIRLASWVIDKNIAYANHKTKEVTLVSGHAEEDERRPHELAKLRLEAGKALLEQFRFLRGDVKTSVRVYMRRDVDNGRRVEISFEPDCPNKCCTGE